MRLTQNEVEALARLRADLEATQFRPSTVRHRLGAAADVARLEGTRAPALHTLEASDTDAFAVQVKALLLGCEIAISELELGFPCLGLEGALELGLFDYSTPQLLRAAISLAVETFDDPKMSAGEQTIDMWIMSDLGDAIRQGPANEDHVMGVGSATRSLLLQAPLPRDLNGDFSQRIGRALDLGTGCGVIALLLAHSGFAEIVATDISERALRFAEMNIHLNLPDQVELIELRSGSLFEPVEGETFDLILSNPPFVITPQHEAGARTYTYRSSAVSGDQLAEQIIREAPKYLETDGEFVCLANWEYRWGENGLERVRQWCDPAVTVASGSRVLAWVLERDRVSAVRYAQMWARDGGARTDSAEYDAAMQDWLRDFTARRVVSIGLGSVRVQLVSQNMPDTAPHPAPQPATVRTEALPGVLSAGAGPELAQTLKFGDLVEQLSAQEILDRRWLRAPEVIELRKHEPGEEAPREITLHKARPVERSVTADTLLAAAIGACDGDLTLEQIADALATLLEVDRLAVADVLCSSVRELVWMGMLRSMECSRY